jgi:integrase
MVKGAKPKDKRYRLGDGDGLYLIVCPEREGGGRYWQYRDRRDGKEKVYSLGVYPSVGLKDARERRDEYKAKLAKGADPTAKPETKPTFEEVAREWFEKHVVGVKAEGTATPTLIRLERYLLPALGSRPIDEITAPDLLAVLRVLEMKGTLETAHRTKQIAGMVFRYGIATGRCEHDITADLRGALATPKKEHHAALTRKEDIVRLLHEMDAFPGSFVVKTALWFSAYTFARPGEIRHAEWSEIELDGADGPVWRIPAEKMKKRRPHIVPLAGQVVELLEGLRPLTGAGRYIFPSELARNGAKCMSENTVNAAIRRMGYGNDEMTAHGFRAMASTNLNETLHYPPDVIERQLAHVEGNAVRAAYNHAEYLPERRAMMTAWANWLDSLRDGGG